MSAVTRREECPKRSDTVVGASSSARRCAALGSQAAGADVCRSNLLGLAAARVGRLEIRPDIVKPEMVVTWHRKGFRLI